MVYIYIKNTGVFSTEEPHLPVTTVKMTDFIAIYKCLSEILNAVQTLYPTELSNHEFI